MVGLTLQAISESRDYRRVENPCIGGSIPPRATKAKRPTVISWAFSFELGFTFASRTRVYLVQEAEFGDDLWAAIVG